MSIHTGKIESITMGGKTFNVAGDGKLSVSDAFNQAFIEVAADDHPSQINVNDIQELADSFRPSTGSQPDSLWMRPQAVLFFFHPDKVQWYTKPLRNKSRRILKKDHPQQRL